MNMSMTVTEHDKKLLLIVGTVGFLVLFITFGLMPAISNMNAAKDDLAAAEARRSDMEYNIALAEPASQNVTNAKNNLLTVVAQFYPLMESRELDTLVTGLELSHSLNPLTMNISDVMPQSITGYVASARAGQSAVATAAEPEATDAAANLGSASATESAADAAAAAGDAALNDTAANSSAAATIATNTDSIYTSTISGTATGTREDCVALLDDVAANYPAAQLIAFSISDTATAAVAAEGEEAPPSLSNFSFTLVVYMCDKEAIQ